MDGRYQLRDRLPPDGLPSGRPFFGIAPVRNERCGLIRGGDVAGISVCRLTGQGLMDILAVDGDGARLIRALGANSS